MKNRIVTQPAESQLAAADEEKRRRRGGRPKLDAAEQRALRVGVPLNAAEFAAITERAKRHNMSSAHFLRHLGLNRRLPRPIPAINFESHRELGELTHVLRDTVRFAQSRCEVFDWQSVERLLSAVQEVRRALLLGGENNGDYENNYGS